MQKMGVSKNSSDATKEQIAVNGLSEKPSEKNMSPKTPKIHPPSAYITESTILLVLQMRFHLFVDLERLFSFVSNTLLKLVIYCSPLFYRIYYIKAVSSVQYVIAHFFPESCKVMLALSGK